MFQAPSERIRPAGTMRSARDRVESTRTALRSPVPVTQATAAAVKSR
ncbi:MAG: hypothetical protein ACRDRE_22020 [Pseudonocardiaceae bacterium]